MKKAYFIGIAGKAMGPLAKSFIDQGWQVSGSDQVNVYPPITDYLEKNNISYFRGYKTENVPLDADLIVVGRSSLMVDSQNPEYLAAKKSQAEVLSYPEVLEKYLIKKNSSVVCGTYGKTTITGLVACLMEKQGLNPSFMVGGIAGNLADSLKITDSDYSVVEGDESPALLKTDPPKFMYYHPKYLLLTATLFDHPEIFDSPLSYKQAFINLVEQVPEDGLLVYNPSSVDPEVSSKSKVKKISYSFEDKNTDYYAVNCSFGQETNFQVSGKANLNLKTNLIGKHNLENIIGAVALCLELGFDPEKIRQGVADYQGIKTRLEYLGEFSGRNLYWDYAQHPAKIKASLQAVKLHYPKAKITVVFDPSSTALKYISLLDQLGNAFILADRVIVGQVTYLKEIPAGERMTAQKIVDEIKKNNENVYYQPVDQDLISEISNKTNEDEVIVFMSSGGLKFTSLVEQVKINLNQKI